MKTHDRLSPGFFILSLAFITCLLITNVVAGRLIALGSFTLTGDLFFFPLTYILGDVLTEVYGFRRTRLTIWAGLAANIFMAAVFMLLLRTPTPEFFDGNAAYVLVLGTTARIVLASSAAYFLGEFVNSVVLSRLKLITQGRWLWLRTIASSIVGQAVDTITFMTIAFIGVYQPSALIPMILVQYGFKLGYEVLATPFTCWLAVRMKRYEGEDHFDYGVKYNPFTLK
ncbi:MAG: queuosine precursor transporter [Syntrophomonadaceae bacterium]|nr:queuosine precursor transporter [Syntrophomonadaceae bacterium]